MPASRAAGTGGADYHQLHVKNFLECMDSRQRPRSDVEIGHNSMIACHLGNIAFRIKRRVQWDVEAEKVVGDAAGPGAGDHSRTGRRWKLA